MHQSSFSIYTFCQCSHPQSTCCPHQISFFFFFCLGSLAVECIHLKKNNRSNSSLSESAWSHHADVPLIENTNGEFMSSVKPDGAARNGGGADVRPRCHGVEEARRVPRPFPLVQIGWCFQPSRAQKWRVFVKGVHDEKRIGKGEWAEYANYFCQVKWWRSNMFFLTPVTSEK